MVRDLLNFGVALVDLCEKEQEVAQRTFHDRRNVLFRFNSVYEQYSNSNIGLYPTRHWQQGITLQEV